MVAGDAGVVHEQPDGAECAVDLCEEPHHVGFVSDVGADRDRGAAGIGDPPHDVAGGRCVTGVVDANRVATRGSEQRRRRADAPARARDDR